MTAISKASTVDYTFHVPDIKVCVYSCQVLLVWVVFGLESLLSAIFTSVVAKKYLPSLTQHGPQVLNHTHLFVFVALSRLIHIIIVIIVVAVDCCFVVVAVVCIF